MASAKSLPRGADRPSNGDRKKKRDKGDVYKNAKKSKPHKYELKGGDSSSIKFAMIADPTTKSLAQDTELAEALVGNWTKKEKHAAGDEVFEEEAKREEKRLRKERKREKDFVDMEVDDGIRKDASKARKPRHGERDTQEPTKSSGLDKLTKKKSSKKRKPEEGDIEVSAENGRVEEAHKKKKSKKRKRRDDEPEAPTEQEILQNPPKDKKHKKQREDGENLEPSTENGNGEDTHKKKKSNKQKHDEYGTKGPREKESGKFHSEKKSKKQKHDDDEETRPPSDNTNPGKAHKIQTRQPDILSTTNHTTEASQWNASALSGDAARREKFLRLLGAGKSDRTLPDSKPKDVAETSHVEAVLQRQFEAGVKMKYDGQGKRRGLGA